MIFDVGSTHEIAAMMTGSRQGVTDEQTKAWLEWLQKWGHVIGTWRMGDAIGADGIITTATQMHIVERHLRIAMQYFHHAPEDVVKSGIPKKNAFWPDSNQWSPVSFWTGDVFSKPVDVATSQGMTSARRWLFFQKWTAANSVEQNNCREIVGQAVTLFRSPGTDIRSAMNDMAQSPLQYSALKALYDYIVIFKAHHRWLNRRALPKFIVHPSDATSRGFWHSIEEKPMFKEMIDKARVFGRLVSQREQAWNECLDAARTYPIMCHEAKEPKARDLDMIRESQLLVAFPADVGYPEQPTRSGTWYTVRHGLLAKRPTYIFYPNGTVEFFASYEGFRRRYPYAPKMSSVAV